MADIVDYFTHLLMSGQLVAWAAACVKVQSLEPKCVWKVLQLFMMHTDPVSRRVLVPISLLQPTSQLHLNEYDLCCVHHEPEIIL